MVAMATASSATAAQAMAAVCSNSNPDGNRWQNRCNRGLSVPSDSVQGPNSPARRMVGLTPSVDSTKNKSRRSLLASVLPPLFRNVSPSPSGRTMQQQQSDICDTSGIFLSEDHHLIEAVKDLEEGDRSGSSVLKELIPLHAELLAEGRGKRDRVFPQKWSVSVPGLPIESALRSVDAVASDIARLVLSRSQIGMLPAFYWPFFGGSGHGMDTIGDLEINEVVLLEEAVEQEAEGGEELQEMAMEDLMALESLVQQQYPRCAWPRGTVSPSHAAITTSPPLNKNMYARCSYPRLPFTAHPYPHPPSSSSNPNVNNSLSASSPSQNHLSSPPLAPRCPWPRGATINSSTVSTAPTAPALSAGEDIDTFERMYAAPSATPPGVSDSPQVPAGPRCVWPRGTSSSTSTPAPLGPRCAWPRHLSIPQEVLPLSSVADVAPLGPRCTWPRNAGRLAVTALPSSSVDESTSAQVTLGPRCAWPKESNKSAPATSAAFEVASWFETASPTAAARTGGSLATSVSCPESTQMGPPCAWPRVVASHTPAAVAVPAGFAEVAMGPRCSWPRAGVQSASGVARMESLSGGTEQRRVETMPRRGAVDSLGEVVGLGGCQGREEATLGARCAWPRIATANSTLTGSESSSSSSASGGSTVEKSEGLNGGVVGVGGMKEAEAVVGKGRRGGLAQLLASGVNGSDRVGERTRGRSLMMKKEVGASWPRRVLGTSVCIGLINQILLSQDGGFALASPLDSIEPSGELSAKVESNDVGFSVTLRPTNAQMAEATGRVTAVEAIKALSRL